MPLVGLDPPSGEWGFALRDVYGVRHEMSDTGEMAIGEPVIGGLMPPFGVAEREMPLKSGSQRQGARKQSRYFTYVMIFQATTTGGLAQRIEQFLGWIDPTQGAGTVGIISIHPDATERELTCSYVGALEGDERGENGVLTWHRSPVRFLAHDPDWVDLTSITESFQQSITPGTFFPMTFPMLLSSSQVIGDRNIDNTGSTDAYPVWTITGPAVTPTIRNRTTGALYVLNTTLAAGATAIIDMEPNASNPIRDGGGNSLAVAQGVGSSRWPLVPGVNRIQVEASSATSATTFAMTYYRRWLRR